MMFSNHFTTVALLLLSSLGQQTIHQVHAQHWNGRATPVTCSICRDANRPILNPTKSFTMTNGNTWTCDYLQETVQDVDANAEFESERLMCVQAQLQGENGGCECGGGGAALPDIQSEVSQELNPACDLCVGQASAVVPTSNYDLAVTTDVVGAQNCQGLYDSLQEGIIDAELCAQVQQAAGATCCSSSSSSSSSSSDSNSGDSSSGFSSPPIIPSTSSDSDSNDSNTISFNTGSDSSTFTSTTDTDPVVTAPLITSSDSNSNDISDNIDSSSTSTSTSTTDTAPVPAPLIISTDDSNSNEIISYNLGGSSSSSTSITDTTTPAVTKQAPLLTVECDPCTLVEDGNALSAACEDSNPIVAQIIAPDSGCGRNWDAFCLLKYNDCYNQACGPNRQSLIDIIAATGGPLGRPIDRQQILDDCPATPSPSPRPTARTTEPPSQRAATPEPTSMPTPCIPKVYGDCVKECVEDLGQSVANCIDFCAENNGGGGNYGGKGGKGGYGGKGSKGGGVCGFGGKGGKGGNKGGKGGKGAYNGNGGYGGKGGKGGNKGGKSGYYQDECCEFVPGYGGKGGKGNKAGYTGGYGNKGGKGGSYNGGGFYGSKGGKGTYYGVTMSVEGLLNGEAYGYNDSSVASSSSSSSSYSYQQVLNTIDTFGGDRRRAISDVVDVPVSSSTETNPTRPSLLRGGV